MSQKDKNLEKSAPVRNGETTIPSVEGDKKTANNKQKGISGEQDRSNSEQQVSDDRSSEKQAVHHHPSLEKFFLDALQDIYYAEAKIEDSLEKIKKKATSEELQEAIEDHELVTKKQILRLEKIFKHLGKEAKKKKCDAIDGILKEVDEMVKNTENDSMTRDAAIIIGTQKVEHYEIATYGGLVQIAITLGYEKIADLLEKTLNEEEETDQLLTDIAEEYINFEAAKE